MLPGNICQASFVSCHSDLPNYFPIWGQGDRWNETQMKWPELVFKKRNTEKWTPDLISSLICPIQWLSGHLRDFKSIKLSPSSLTWLVSWLLKAWILLFLTINLWSKLRYMQGGCPCLHPGISLRFIAAKAEIEIYFQRVFIINHNTTPRMSCFLRHLLFDKLKVTDIVVTFSPSFTRGNQNASTCLFWQSLEHL